jgi:NADH:ubiquinone oxidoreductase subunit H
MAAILSMGTAVIASGTFRAEGIVAAQGAAPWSWHAFRSPAATALAVLFMVALYAGAPDRLQPAPDRPLTSAQFARQIAGWIGTFFVAAAGVTALFGGWHVPGSDLGGQDASAALQMAGAMLFLLKTWALTLTTAWLRWTSSSTRGAALVHRAGGTIALTALLAAIAHCTVALLTPRLPSSVAMTLSHTTFALIFIAIFAATLRARAQRVWGLSSYVPPVFSNADESVLH